MEQHLADLVWWVRFFAIWYITSKTLSVFAAIIPESKEKDVGDKKELAELKDQLARQSILIGELRKTVYGGR